MERVRNKRRMGRKGKGKNDHEKGDEKKRKLKQ